MTGLSLPILAERAHFFLFFFILLFFRIDFILFISYNATQGGREGRAFSLKALGKPPPPMSPSDLHMALSSLLGIMAAEVVVKPVLTRLGRWLLTELDRGAGDLLDLPEWLKTGM